MDKILKGMNGEKTNRGPLKLRREGFPGQHVIVLPDSVRKKMSDDVWLLDLYPVASGAFPRVAGHEVVRRGGVVDAILIFVREGSGWVETEGNRRLLKAGEMSLIPPEVAHSYGACAEDSWAIDWVHFSGDRVAGIVGAICTAFGVEPGELVSGPWTGSSMNLNDIWKPLELGYSRANLLASALVLRETLQRLWLERLGEGHSGDPVGNLLRWMGRHLDQPATLKEMATVAGISVPHLCVLFRRVTDFTPIEYFTRLRAQRAAQLLDSTYLRIQEIAASLGWSDPYHFSRVFKRLFGRSPRSYRKLIKG